MEDWLAWMLREDCVGLGTSWGIYVQSSQPLLLTL